MAEVLAQLVLGLIEAAFDLLLAHTGRRVLAVFGWKSSSLVEIWSGLAVLAIVGLLILAVTASFSATP